MRVRGTACAWWRGFWTAAGDEGLPAAFWACFRERKGARLSRHDHPFRPVAASASGSKSGGTADTARRTRRSRPRARRARPARKRWLERAILSHQHRDYLGFCIPLVVHQSLNTEVLHDEVGHDPRARRPGAQGRRRERLRRPWASQSPRPSRCSAFRSSGTEDCPSNCACRMRRRGTSLRRQTPGRILSAARTSRTCSGASGSDAGAELHAPVQEGRAAHAQAGPGRGQDQDCDDRPC